MVNVEYPVLFQNLYFVMLNLFQHLIFFLYLFRGSIEEVLFNPLKLKNYALAIVRQVHYNVLKSAKQVHYDVLEMQKEKKL